MAFGEVTLVPGVNVERTPTLLRAGVSQSALIRFKDGLVQKYGGWSSFFNGLVQGIPRDLHGWEDVNQQTHLSIGTTARLSILSNGVMSDITPQVFASSAPPLISTASGSTTVTISDNNVGGSPTIYDAVFFNVPVSQGGIILDGLYQIISQGASSYTITAQNAATTTELNTNQTSAPSANGTTSLTFGSVPAWVVAGMVVSDRDTPTAIPSSTTVVSVTGGGTVVNLSNPIASITSAGVAMGDLISFSSVPVFAFTAGSQIVTVTLIGHGLSAGNTVVMPTTLSASAIASGITLAGSSTLNFVQVPSWVTAGMLVSDGTHTSAIPAGTTVVSKTATTVLLSQPVQAPGVSANDFIFFSPGAEIIGSYTVASVVDANHFTISIGNQSLVTATIAANNGQMQLTYYITQGAAGVVPGGGKFGFGAFGAGPFGVGGSTTSPPLAGSSLSATDWTSDNWGNILLACPKGGAIFYYDPTGGFTNASIISTGPIFNNGIFVSIAQQIVVAYGSSIHQNIGYQQQPLLVQWCDVGNFFQWQALATDQAGNFVIPTGSAILGGMAAGSQNLLWTDIDLWAMNFLGPPNEFGFVKIGAGAGLCSSHAAQPLRGSVYWMGPTNFYSYTSGGVNVIPCPVWDAVFQNINTQFLQNVRSMPNTPFNEAGWLYPSKASLSGENDSYVKMNILEGGSWDYGPIQRSAWTDQSVLGNPIGTTSSGAIYQHETGFDAGSQPMGSSFTTGYFYLAQGEEFVFVDQVMPDFKWGTFGGAQGATIIISFNVVNFPGDTPIVYGPYSVTQATKFISTRFRGRLMSITIQSADVGSFWRIGSIKYRYSPAGRR